MDLSGKGNKEKFCLRFLERITVIGPDSLYRSWLAVLPTHLDMFFRPG
jgi:hypothetical protein